MAAIAYSPLRIRVNSRRCCCLCNRQLCMLLFFLLCIVTFASTLYLRTQEFEIAQFKKRPEVADIQCDRIFKGDILYAKNLSRRALIPTSPDLLDMGCDAVRKRVYSRHNPPTGFQIAYVKTVYKDYEFLEEQLAVTYSEENTYCFALDRKAPLDFRRRFLILSICLDNVLVSSEEHDLDSKGRHQSSAHLDCLRNMRRRPWNYAILQQNHDIVVKTNAEIVEIFKTMGGANDMEMSKCPLDDRCDLPENNLGKLGLCPTDLSKDKLEACEKQEITMAKGWVQVSLTHETVDFLLDKINTTRLIDELHKTDYGMDELFIQSLAATRALGMPGMYPSRCLHDNDSVAPSNHLFITRLTHWDWWKEYGCGSNIWRCCALCYFNVKKTPLNLLYRIFGSIHMICIFGVEDLPYLAGVHHIMVNKLMPDTDYGAISCIGELLFNRTHRGLDDHPLDYEIYKNLPAVRLQKGMREDPTYFDRFECPKYPQRKKKQLN